MLAGRRANDRCVPLPLLLAVMLAGIPLAFDLIDGAKQLSSRADGKSGRDIRSWVEAAEHSAVARAIDAGDPEAIMIEMRDFDD